MRITQSVNLIRIFFELLGEFYNEIKHYLLLILGIVLLMAGIATKHFLLIILSILLTLISIGAMRYETEYEKNGKKIHKTGKDKLVEPKKAE